ncbi:MAG: hypothetical protein ABIA04_08405 [Pseudomonadota bacterium]
MKMDAFKNCIKSFCLLFITLLLTSNLSLFAQSDLELPEDENLSSILPYEGEFTQTAMDDLIDELDEVNQLLGGEPYVPYSQRMPTGSNPGSTAISRSRTRHQTFNINPNSEGIVAVDLSSSTSLSKPSRPSPQEIVKDKVELKRAGRILSETITWTAAVGLAAMIGDDPDAEYFYENIMVGRKIAADAMTESIERQIDKNHSKFYDEPAVVCVDNKIKGQALTFDSN